MMAKTAAGPTPCLVGSGAIHAADERTSKWYEHSSGETPTKVVVEEAIVERESLSQWKEMIVDFFCLESLSPQGEPLVYCRTRRLPLRVSSLELVLPNTYFC